MEQLQSINIKLDNLTAIVQELQNFRPKAMLNLGEAASYLGISKSTLYKHTSAGNISYYKPAGKLILFKKEDLDQWIYLKRIPCNQELKMIN